MFWFQRLANPVGNCDPHQQAVTDNIAEDKAELKRRKEEDKQRLENLKSVERAARRKASSRAANAHDAAPAQDNQQGGDNRGANQTSIRRLASS